MKQLHDTSFIILLETHTSGDRAAGIVKRLGFKGSFVKDACGHARGTWCLWNENMWQVDVIRSDNQFVHMKVKWKIDNPWFLTAVYGAPQFTRSQQLWRDLVSISDSLKGTWAVMGDFNSNLAHHERKGGISIQPHRDMHRFREVLRECELIDAGFQGDTFTWKKTNMEGRLDSFLINMNW